MEMLNTASTSTTGKTYDLPIIALSRQTIIIKSDLESLDILARYVIATELWSKCADCARQALLSDRVPLVREAADTSRILKLGQTKFTTSGLN